MWKTFKGHILVRFGLAFSFLYAGIGGFVRPENWIGWFPVWARDLFPWGDGALLAVFGVFEILLGLWLISGAKLFWSSLVAGVLLIGISIFNFGSMDIIFRDIALALAAFGLAVLSREKRDIAAHTHE